MSDPLGLISSHTTGARPAGPAAPRPPQGPSAPTSPSFKDVLMANIEQVNRLQQDAQTAIEDLQTGKRDDVANVLIAKQHADDAFRLLLQVRNKLMDAYEEVKQIRV